ncbi:MAG: protease-4 [Cyclobacteriaceae bacterium]|jgi:protease-4
MAFLRNLLATIVGLFIFFFLGIMLVAAIASAGDETPVVESNSVLGINMSGFLMERTKDDPLEQLFGNSPAPLSLIDILAAIKAAKNDSKIHGIYIKPMYLQAGQSSLLEIRNALVDFKESGKFIYAYGEYISESDYMVVSVADSLFLNPEGSLEFNGLNASVTFFKGLFDKLDIEPEIFRVGEYKSAIEPFIRKDLSDENKLQLSELLGSIHQSYLNAVEGNTSIDFLTLKNISDKMLARNPETAMQYGLISKVGYEDELKTVIRRKIGLDEEDEINFISCKKYMKSISGTYSSNKIAVIVADGEIVMGSDSEVVGGKQFADEIRKARENESVKAIVLRVNSPGGSLTASEQIWREIKLTKGVKPIIASMSNVAASGGYYIAAPCDTIIAQPNTITGSIGIFGMMFNFGEFLENKLGITSDNVNTGEFSDYMTVMRTLTPGERMIIQTQIERGYETFVTRVSEGRGMTRDEVKNVAGGRVWSGAQALDRGLVDILGSYEDAIVIAATKAGVADDYRVRYYPEQKEFLDQLLENIEDMNASIFATKESIITPYLKKIESLQRMTGIQARMPGDLQIN